jgi:hypothetical protein
MHHNTDDDSAAQRLAALSRYFREHPVTGQQTRVTAPTNATAPANLGVLDHIRASLRDVEEHTRAIDPEAGPLPQRVEAVYDWMRQHTEHADDVQRQRGAALELRHQLEHAVRMGDASAVRRHRCPECRTFGLFWKPALWRAVCTNRNCLTPDGTSRTWTLARLAYEHTAAAEKSVRVRAT